MFNLFKHKHNFTMVGDVFHPSKKNPLSACPCTAKIYRCKCGEEKRELTGAGYQQLSWGDDINELRGYK